MRKSKIKISNEDFIQMLIDVFSTDFEAEKRTTLKYLDEEFSKPKNERDYILIHECYLTLSECFGYEYNNEYKFLSIKQQCTRKVQNAVKEKRLPKVAMF